MHETRATQQAQQTVCWCTKCIQLPKGTKETTYFQEVPESYEMEDNPGTHVVLYL